MKLEKKIQKSPREYLLQLVNNFKRNVLGAHALKFDIKLRKYHFSATVLPNGKRNRRAYIVTILMKPTLQLIHDSATKERTWVIGKPDACLKRFLVNFVPIGKHSFESLGNGSCNGFRKKIEGSSSSNSRTAGGHVPRNI
jgi:hypothetical protein